MNEKNGMQNISDLFASRLPTLIWVSIVYVGTIVLQFLREHLILESAVFTGLFTIHVLLHWNSYRVTYKKFWIYFSVQAALIYLCAILMRDGYQAVLIGLLPILIAQTLSYSFRVKRVVFVSLISIIVFFDSALTVGDRDELIVFLPIFLLMLIVVLAYAILFFKQVQERLRIQSFLEDLREAHEKVEELTLANERQRMARDLHDTLAQGVAGLIMRLEAADAHMSQNHPERAQEIIRQSMQQARRTLAEARRAIDNLRLKSAPEMDFKEAIADEIEHFREATGIVVSTDYRLNKRLSRLQMEHSLHIVKECLTNIARHAKADKVWVFVSTQNDKLIIEIQDNGIGFKTDDIGKDAGHYGLLGIKERVRLIGGEIYVNSNSEGTRVKLETPFIRRRT
ncbi:sensor histidine kinase [Paenibacillus riograndensis]|uniref:histidine kinase n=1 Tax=Paenibacillus riograndensis SBR5 TaxID=1073571 RepID=A0A0E4CV61_9BACL|nr:sensor histidine kinase [Paenibacillus riograndensis]CQR53590.1 membrane associated, signal transduction histidine kinase-like ATPase [Paenibacillus riograndensis SBR5]